MSSQSLRPAVHARITPDVESGWVATCEEIAVVTQGETLDEVTANLREAVALHLDGEDLAALGFVPEPSIIITMGMSEARALKTMHHQYLAGIRWALESPLGLGTGG